MKVKTGYLGPPILVGRSKYKNFSWLKEKVWQRVSNWKNRFLSQAGREVLVKASLQAIHVYTMSLFRLPKSLCNKLEMLMTNF